MNSVLDIVKMPEGTSVNLLNLPNAEIVATLFLQQAGIGPDNGFGEHKEYFITKFCIDKDWVRITNNRVEHCLTTKKLNHALRV